MYHTLVSFKHWCMDSLKMEECCSHVCMLLVYLTTVYQWIAYLGHDTNTWIGAGGNRLSGDWHRKWEPLFSTRQVRGINKRKEIQNGEWRILLNNPIQPADLDLDGTGLDESKHWMRKADALMLTLTFYTLLVLQTKRYLFGSIGERPTAKQYMEQKKWLNFFTL